MLSPQRSMLILQIPRDLRNSFASHQRIRTVAAADSLVMEVAGALSTAKLSIARSYLSATSLPSQGLALFAGGFTDVGALLRKLTC